MGGQFVNFIMLCNHLDTCLNLMPLHSWKIWGVNLWISSCCAIVCVFHHVVQYLVYFTMLCNWLCISPCCAMLLLVYFTMLCYCFWISPCCAIACVFHLAVQLFAYFTILCKRLYISPCCAIVCVFYHVVHVVKFFLNFTMLCNCLCISPVVQLFLNSPFCHEVVLQCCWGVVEVLLGCCWGVIMSCGDTL